MPPRIKERQRSATVPNLSPDAAVAYNQQLQQLYLQRQDALQALREQRAEIRAAFQIARAGIERERNLALEQAVNVALDRGLLGGSVDLERRRDVMAEAAERLAQAINARNQALLANLAQAMAARREYAMGLANIAASRAAEQALINAQQFLEGTGPYFGGAGFGGGPGVLPPSARKKLSNMTESIQRLFDTLATVPPGTRQEYINRLQELWRERNLLRKKYGLKPVPRSKLRRLLQLALATNESPGMYTPGAHA